VQARAGAYIPEKVLVTDLAWALPIGRQTSGTLPRPLWRPAGDTAGRTGHSDSTHGLSWLLHPRRA
jgi:hypothetical protein